MRKLDKYRLELIQTIEPNLNIFEKVILNIFKRYSLKIFQIGANYIYFKKWICLLLVSNRVI